jgi:hypothetical protein
LHLEEDSRFPSVRSVPRERVVQECPNLGGDLVFEAADDVFNKRVDSTEVK